MLFFFVSLFLIQSEQLPWYLLKYLGIFKRTMIFIVVPRYFSVPLLPYTSPPLFYTISFQFCCLLVFVFFVFTINLFFFFFKVTGKKNAKTGVV